VPDEQRFQILAGELQTERRRNREEAADVSNQLLVEYEFAR